MEAYGKTADILPINTVFFFSTDEPRIQLSFGDIVKVTRWKKYWLYGDKVNSEERIRGWFPRKCAIEIIDNGHYHDHRETKKAK